MEEGWKTRRERILNLLLKGKPIDSEILYKELEYENRHDFIGDIRAIARSIRKNPGILDGPNTDGNDGPASDNRAESPHGSLEQGYKEKRGKKGHRGRKRRKKAQLLIRPARCIQCGYEFVPGDNLFSIPTKCPRCKSERIIWPVLLLKSV